MCDSQKQQETDKINSAKYRGIHGNVTWATWETEVREEGKERGKERGRDRRGDRWTEEGRKRQREGERREEGGLRMLSALSSRLLPTGTPGVTSCGLWTEVWLFFSFPQTLLCSRVKCEAGRVNYKLMTLQSLNLRRKTAIYHKLNSLFTYTS